MSRWPTFVLRYRHTVLALLLGLMVLGLQARFELPVLLFPDSDPPTVTVITEYPGMAATDVDSDLSRLLEEEFASLDGVTDISATSQTGLSVVRLEFDFEMDSAMAMVDVQNAIGRIRRHLPSGIGEPQVLEFSTADKPIVTLAVHSDELPLSEIRELADNRIRESLERIAGVAVIDVIGGHKRELHVALDRDRLAELGIPASLVTQALQNWNLSAPGGRLLDGQAENVIRFDAPLASPSDAANVPLRVDERGLIRVGDVADVQLRIGEQRAAYRFQGETGIAIQVLRRDDANTVEVAARVRDAVDELRHDLPAVNLLIADDDSVFTENVMSDMTRTVLIAIGLTMLVVLLFLSSFRQASIVALSIPAAFLSTFALMQMVGLDLNMVTMSALIIAIGLLVDDGIVILENIHRHLQEKGVSPREAAIAGTGEILPAKLGGTLTTIGVLLPLVFMGGFVGELFRPLATTLVFALSSSFVMAVTVIPLLATYWLRADLPTGNRNPVRRSMETALDGIRGFYLVLLGAATRRPLATLAVAVVLLVAGLGLLRLIGSEMLPRFDSGSFQVLVDTVPGTPLEETLMAASETETILLGRDYTESVSIRAGHEPGARALGQRGAMAANQAEVTVNLVPRDERKRDQWSIMDEVREHLETVPGITLSVPQAMGGTARSSTAANVVVRISGEQPERLNAIADELLTRLRDVPGITDLFKDWALDTPELRVSLNRDRAAELGLSGKRIASAVHRAVDGRIISRYRQSPRRDLDIVVRYEQASREQLDELSEVLIDGPTGPVRLSEVASVDSGVGPRLLSRENGSRTLDVLGYHSGRPLSEVVAEIERRLAEYQSPAGYQVQLAGEQDDFTEARRRMLRTLGLSALAVYLLLVIQFSSFRHPLTIMAAIPLQFVGVALALLLAGKYMSMSALLGVILLVGIVVNNSIILLDMARQGLREGAELSDAVSGAVSARLRPILMTATSTVVGMLPLAMELAVGSERFSPIATVIIGGVLAATLLTLVIVPTLFMAMERRWPSQRGDSNPGIDQSS